MTPERLAEIRELLQSENPDSIARYGTNGIYQYAKDVRTAAMDLLAEIATLKAMAEGWKSDAERHCRNEFYYTGLLDEIAKNFGRESYTSDDGSIQQDPLRAKMPELVATLRTRLDALVTAGEKVVDTCEYVSVNEGRSNEVEIFAANLTAIDALAAAVREAKGEK